eukprot:CAMPEP_0201739416 /NCGR_PEP_ID=MMETSP0593-20130828/45773_1 /ASSEMBLY_ACC=CAM_ASM_000672 /TAXON_ID=267983 /ORGANISM="Skeletonema japonicum, Strain CCMP2506" /LENGTH=379 /DNA_ID=CAMNT_0048233687 /DNA_START=428 /DNA_END=1567 /DNA_ORIENTATION=-
MITDDSHNYNNTKSLHLQISQGRISNTIPITQIHDAIHQRNQQYLKAKDANALPLSPACYPHFNHYSTNTNNNNGQLSFSWNNNTKFKRILFYHARKAGGSSMNKYLVKVAQHYNIHLEWIEWNTMEEPGLLQHFDKPDTFYVTHVREPIERSISHFKYNGRWPCKTMLKREFVPTLENALTLESWNETQGHVPKKQCHYNRKENTTAFYLGDCAVNCYIQWFGGLSCPRWKVPMEQQYEVAMSKLLKYNLIVVIDKLHDPRYVEAMEQFFGVRGILERGKPFCERMSHKTNEEHPLVVREETKARLIELNRLDLKLYHEITDCLEDDVDGNYYEHIPKWDGSRFQLDSYNWTEAQIEKDRAKALRKEKRKKKNGQREE